jgi:hypothetical protein
MKSFKSFLLNEVSSTQSPSFAAFRPSFAPNTKEKKSIETQAMNPSGSFTPVPETQSDRDSDPMKVASRAARREEGGTDQATTALLNAAPAEAAGAATVLAGAGPIGAALATGGAVGRILRDKFIEQPTRDLEFQKTIRTPAALPQEYAKAAEEAANRRKALGIESWEKAPEPKAQGPRQTIERGI